MKKLLLPFSGLLFVSLIQAQTKHYVGEEWGGGIVIVIASNGLHGLIAETQDQGSATWSEMVSLIKDTANHSAAGKAFKGWRLPTQDELYLLYQNKGMIGGFTYRNYWSSTKDSDNLVWGRNLSTGNELYLHKDASSAKVRAVRDF